MRKDSNPNFVGGGAGWRVRPESLDDTSTKRIGTNAWQVADPSASKFELS